VPVAADLLRARPSKGKDNDVVKSKRLTVKQQQMILTASAKNGLLSPP